MSAPNRPAPPSSRPWNAPGSGGNRQPTKGAETWHMPEHVRTPGAIVVVAAEDDRFDGALRRATDLAGTRREPLILYDWDAPSLVSDPMPSWWSSDGWDRRFPDRLEPEQLDELGRSSIADQVRHARKAGVEAFAWLPSAHGPGKLAEYASAQGASMVVVPRDLTELHGLDALINGSPRPADEVAERVAAAVVIV